MVRNELSHCTVSSQVRAAPVVWSYLWFTRIALVLCAFGPSACGEFLEPSESFTLTSMAEAPTQLPCLYRVVEEKVVQVSWTRERPDGTKEQIITAHSTDGHKEFGQFSGRVRFANSDPIADAALIVLSTEESDSGKYTCHISTFPSGNFERQMSLTVWTKPISSLESVELVEGQPLSVAATCRSMGHPPPLLTWDTDLPGQSQNRSSKSGAVSTTFSVQPLRSMLGKQLDCLVWHPTLELPYRISSRLLVHYPPDAKISGYNGNWFAGLEKASLRCNSTGSPTPKNFTWTRRNRALPPGVSVENGVLLFGRPLLTSDAGVYECSAQNSVGAGRNHIEITVAEPESAKPIFSSLMIFIVAAIAGVLVAVTVISVILVNCYHKKRNRKLEMELKEKKEELSSLSRQTSFRRLNSINSDPRIQMEENIPLRPESTLSSVADSVCRRESRTTRGGSRAAELDFLGRPVLYNSSHRSLRGREKEMEADRLRDETQWKVESFLGSSESSLDNGIHPSASKTSLSTVKLANGSSNVEILPAVGGRNQTSPTLTIEEMKEQKRVSTDEDDEEDDDGDDDICQISEALTNHFHYSNGVLRPKPHPNGILIQPNGRIVGTDFPLS